MSIARLDTGFNIEVEFPITPFHRRAIAWLIDWLILFLYSIIMNKFLTASISPSWQHQHYWLSVIVGAPVVLYHLVMEITMNGQSIGKMIMNIKVITLEGGQPTLSQYFIRWMFRSIDFLWWAAFTIHPVFIFLVFSGVVCIIATPYSQRIGDLVAGTILIDTKHKTSWQDTIFMQVEDNYKPSFPEVMKLSDRDVNTIKQIFTSVKKTNDLAYASSIAAKVQQALNIKTDMSSIDFLEILLKDYNYYTGK